MLLKPIEETNYTWIASSTTKKGLNPTFVSRFKIKIKTELPSLGGLARWLDDRARSG